MVAFNPLDWRDESRQSYGMSKAHAAFLREIESFLREHDISESQFQKLAGVNDGKFLGRIRSGGDVTLRTAERVRDFMSRYRRFAASKSRARTGARPSAGTASASNM